MYLEWLEYKTAKPLLYTVYITGKQKQLGRKSSGKEISFDTVPKNSRCWGGQVTSGGRLFQRRLPAPGNA